MDSRIHESSFLITSSNQRQYGSTGKDKGGDDQNIELSEYSQSEPKPEPNKPIKSLSKQKEYISYSDQVGIDDCQLSDVIIPTKLFDKNPNRQANNIVAEFNQRALRTQNTFETSLFFGDWVKPNEFIIGACNQIPEMRTYDGAMKIRRAWYADPTINTEILSLEEQSALFFGAYGSYVLNVPVNKLVKAWSGNVPLLFGTGPHVVHDPNFKFDVHHGLVDQSDCYINHGSIHIVRVPAGLIAKVWIGAVPLLLESRKEPYVFNSSLFQIQKANDQKLFFDATIELIIHGSIKRVMPRTGRVAVTYNNGNLEIIPPNKNGRPTYIDSPSHEVSSFLDTNVQAHVFPSAEEKQRRMKDNQQITPEELNKGMTSQ